ncbi:myotrophin [Drosophila mauritiana]|uniref:Myotrophin n=1 Tax=Drosophila mauritiana TaxID=7226 RepID=A0A6P8KNM7_DROMA|nr:myotrophin [Drosophila mauritiana]
MGDGHNIEGIIWTIKNGVYDEVERIFLAGSLNVNDQMGVRFPLHYAADFGQLKLLKFFVRIGAEVDRKDKYGITPLLAAIWEGHTRCVEFLLQMGASRTERTPEGQSYAGAAKQEDIRRLLARD